MGTTGPGKFAVAPLVFTSIDKKSAVFIIHVGGGLCGHEGVVHGGLLATILDEALGRTVGLLLSNLSARTDAECRPSFHCRTRSE